MFSDPIYQGLFEALMAQGRSKEEALDEVTNEIKLRMNALSELNLPIVSDPLYTPDYPGSTAVPHIWVGGNWCDGSDTISFNVTDEGEVLVNYTMHDGKEVNWLCK